MGFEIGPREGIFLGSNLGRAIVTNGDSIAVSDNIAGSIAAMVITSRSSETSRPTHHRTCATAPRRGPLPKLLWADLFLLL